MSDEQPIDPLADPSRQLAAFERAKKSLAQIMSPSFGSHTRIYGDAGGRQTEQSAGDGRTKSRAQQMVDDAVERTTAEIGRVSEAIADLAQNIIVSAGEPAAPAQGIAPSLAPEWEPRGRDEQGEYMAATWPNNESPADPPPAILDDSWHEPASFTASPAPWVPAAAPPAQPVVAAPREAPRDAVERVSLEGARVERVEEKPAINVVSEPETSTTVDKTEPRSGPMPWQIGDAWKTPPPHVLEMEPGADSASQPLTGAQHRHMEQMLDLGGVIDDYGISMAEFAEAVGDTIRTLTRRLNDITRALQGEGSDIL